MLLLHLAHCGRKNFRILIQTLLSLPKLIYKENNRHKGNINMKNRPRFSYNVVVKKTLLY